MSHLPKIARRQWVQAVCVALTPSLLAMTANGAAVAKRIGLLHAAKSYRGLPQLLGVPLRELGVATTFEVRSADGQPERLVALAAELVALRIDILLVDGDAQAVRAAMQATRTVPIVFLSIGDPVAEGLVQSLGRPGGNVTGLSSQSPELEAKRLDMLLQTVPTIRRVAVITHPANRALVAAMDLMREVSARAALSLAVFEVAARAEMAQALRSIARNRVDALIQQDDWMLNDILSQTGVFALEQRLPLAASLPGHGVLVSYGARDANEEERQLVRLLQRLATGTRPSDLPIEQPSTFVLAVNLGVAELLGVTVPASLRLRADYVGRW